MSAPVGKVGGSDWGDMTEALPRRNAAVLVGNGLSIAFNEKLNLTEITREMISRIQAATDNGDKVIRAMKVIAGRAVSHGDVTDDDFEKFGGGVRLTSFDAGRT